MTSTWKAVPLSWEYAMQVHSPRPFPTQVHLIMWPISCCLSHWSPTRYMIPSLVVQISSWAGWEESKKPLYEITVNCGLISFAVHLWNFKYHFCRMMSVDSLAGVHSFNLFLKANRDRFCTTFKGCTVKQLALVTCMLLYEHRHLKSWVFMKLFMGSDAALPLITKPFI